MTKQNTNTSKTAANSVPPIKHPHVLCRVRALKERLKREAFAFKQLERTHGKEIAIKLKEKAYKSIYCRRKTDSALPDQMMIALAANSGDCKYCCKLFSSQKSLKQHVKKCQLGKIKDKAYRFHSADFLLGGKGHLLCPVCPGYFNGAAAVKWHIDADHKADSEKLKTFGFALQEA